MRVPRLAGAGRRRSDWPRRGWSAAVLGVAGALVVTLVGAGPAAAAGATLKVDPAQGRPSAPFTIGLQSPPENGTCPALVSFTWDGTVLQPAARVVRDKRTNMCVASLATRPPVDDRDPGPHVVGVFGRTTPTQKYTILPGLTVSARPSPTQSRTSADATRQPTADATDDTVAGGVDTSPAGVAPLATGAPSVADAASGGSGGGLMSWILIFGGLLVLGGITIFGLLIYWTRRGGPGELDADTQVFGE